MIGHRPTTAAQPPEVAGMLAAFAVWAAGTTAVVTVAREEPQR